MKLVSYTLGGAPDFGIRTDAGIIALGKRTGAASLKALLASGGLARAAAHADAKPDHALADITLLPVIPDPGKIICVGLNYHDHIAEMGRTASPRPTLFVRFAGSQVAHGAPMLRPPESVQFDYEGEMAVIIGKGGRRIAEADALSHVAGYACYNDGSIRDWQGHSGQFTPGKNFAATGGFGPWMVTADEIPDPSRLHLQTRLNGKVVQDVDTSLMITPVPELIRYCSTFQPLEPGDVIVSGTPGGVGAKRNPPLWMKHGDTVEVEISGIGILKNPVRDE